MLTKEKIAEIVENIEYIDQRKKKKKKWMDYQTICSNSHTMYKGQRDIYERLNLIYKEDLQGKSIIDFGCNIGMNCQIAIELGAIKATGVDVYSHLIEVANKVNTLYGNDCSFIQADLAKPVKLEKADTGFVFALNVHVNNDEMLAQNIKNNIKDVVYFETHTNKKFRNLPPKVEEIFKTVKLIGKTHKEQRNFYRCIL